MPSYYYDIVLVKEADRLQDYPLFDLIPKECQVWSTVVLISSNEVSL